VYAYHFEGTLSVNILTYSRVSDRDLIHAGCGRRPRKTGNQSKIKAMMVGERVYVALYCL
jgi:hypothetical protein